MISRWLLWCAFHYKTTQPSTLITKVWISRSNLIYVKTIQTLQEGGDILRKTQFSKPCEREELFKSKILTLNGERMCLEWRTIEAICILCKACTFFRAKCTVYNPTTLHQIPYPTMQCPKPDHAFAAWWISWKILQSAIIWPKRHKTFVHNWIKCEISLFCTACSLYIILLWL